MQVELNQIEFKAKGIENLLVTMMLKKRRSSPLRIKKPLKQSF
jgi:hypothetical protein